MNLDVLTDTQKRLLMDVAWECLQTSWVDLLHRQPWNCGVEIGISESELNDARVLRNLRLIKLVVRDMNACVTKKGYELIEQDVLANITPVSFKASEVA